VLERPLRFDVSDAGGAPGALIMLNNLTTPHGIGKADSMEASTDPKNNELALLAKWQVSRPSGLADRWNSSALVKAATRPASRTR
jgi:hypothetical protein